jgi:hypothetical protein
MARALVLVVEGSPGRAAALLCDRFPNVAVGRQWLRLAIGSSDGPEAILACCRERGIGVRASSVSARPVDGGAAPSRASAPLDPEEVVP